MPMKSKAEERFLWAKHPGIAKNFQAVTHNASKLPEHVKKKDKRKK